MLRVYACVTEQHDVRLVILAGLICLFACFAATSLVARARQSKDWTRHNWLLTAAGVFGCGVWATHFVAMLAFKPNMLIGYDIGLTALSILMAVSITWLGFRVALGSGAQMAALGGGTIVGFAVFTMHYTGMAAMRVPANVHYDGGFVLASLAVGAVLGAAAIRVAARGLDLRHRGIGAAVLAAAIVGLHFTAMAAVQLEPDPRIPLPEAVLAPAWLAVAVAAMTTLIVALGLTGSIVDQRFAERAAQEAVRLRAYIVELEETKKELEATATNLVSALEAAAAGSQAKSQFLATMSHELRTPLNAILGFSEMLSAQIFGSLGDPRYCDYVTIIQDSGTHLLGLINDVLDFAKIESGHLELQEEVINLGEALQEAVRMIGPQAREAKIALYETAEPCMPYLRADPRRIRQILLNLLSNAVKFTPSGGEVRASAFRRGAELAIAVVDTGIGIAPEDIPKALERFGQVDSRLGRKYEGTGLGLPLSKRFVELHGGAFKLESVIGRGTTVTMTFPSQRVIATRQAAA